MRVIAVIRSIVRRVALLEARVVLLAIQAILGLTGLFILIVLYGRYDGEIDLIVDSPSLPPAMLTLFMAAYAGRLAARARWEGSANSLRRENQLLRLQLERANAASTAAVARIDVAGGFREWSDRASRSSILFLTFAVATLAGSTGLAVWLIQSEENLSVSGVLTRLSVTIPGTVIATLLAAESSTRRRYAQWGSLISIQAEHIGEYVADLDPEDQRLIQRRFALSVFSGGSVLPETTRLGGPPKTKPPETPIAPPPLVDPLAMLGGIVDLLQKGQDAEKTTTEVSKLQNEADLTQIGAAANAISAQYAGTVAAAEASEKQAAARKAQAEALSARVDAAEKLREQEDSADDS